MSWIIDKYRQEAYKHFHHEYKKYPTWREAILECIFQPKCSVPGKTDMSHLHPNLKNLHFPHGVYMADWRKYRVEDHPALVNFQKRCNAAGLHDPWLRNYAHHFYPNKRVFRSKTRFMSTGLGFGFLVASIIVTIEKVYDIYNPPVYEHTKEYIAKHGIYEISH